MTEFPSENSVIWHSLELAEGGILVGFNVYGLLHVSNSASSSSFSFSKSFESSLGEVPLCSLSCCLTNI